MLSDLCFYVIFHYSCRKVSDTGKIGLDQLSEYYIFLVGATPPRVRRRNHAPSAPPVRERDPLLEADREAERKYRELIREAEKLLVTVSRAPLEPPHNPRIRELRATEVSDKAD